MMMSVEAEAPRPILRGWSHTIAIAPALAGAVALIVIARGNPAKQASLAVYGTALTGLFTVSALYHRVGWSPAWRTIWRRIDHANIFVVIAATYTPVAVNVLDGWMRVTVLVAIWTAALAGVSLMAARIELPRPAMVVAYVAVGWIALIIVPSLYARLGMTGVLLLFAGGLLYSLGAITYAFRRPNLWPRVFGYHEVFHLFVIAATAVFFVFIALVVVPAGHA
jgi:hemolysin III